MESKLTVLQKLLLVFVYGLILLMVVFSVLAIKDKGQEGYERCIQKKCEAKGQEFCSKFREVNNCCLGASGKTAQSGNELICVFD